MVRNHFILVIFSLPFKGYNHIFIKKKNKWKNSDSNITLENFQILFLLYFPYENFCEFFERKYWNLGDIVDCFM